MSNNRFITLSALAIVRSMFLDLGTSMVSSLIGVLGVGFLRTTMVVSE